MFNYKKQLDNTALQSTMNVTQNQSHVPFSHYSCNQTYDQENTLTYSIAYPNSQITQKRHHKMASQYMQRINSIIFDVQENTFHKAKAIQAVQEVNSQIVHDLKNRKVPSFGAQKSFNLNIRQTLDQGLSNFGSVYKHNRTGSDIPLSVLIDQTSYHQNSITSQNIKISNFNKGTDQWESITDIKQALNEEMKKNKMFNHKIYNLEKQNKNLKEQNNQSIKLQRQNKEIIRQIKSYSLSNVSSIGTNKTLNQQTQLKKNQKHYRQQINNYSQRINLRY